MSDDPSVTIIGSDGQSQYLTQALYALLRQMGAERVIQLAALLDEVISVTGYGDVKVVVADRKVALLKAEKSFR